MPDENDNKDKVPDAVQAALAKLIEKSGGDTSSVALKLYDDNHSLREKNRTLKADVERLAGEVTASKAPDAETKTALEQYAEYKAYGTPAEVKAKLERGTQLEARVTADDRDKLAREAAGLVGYNADTLAAIAADKSLSLEIKDETGTDGKPARVPYVQMPKDGDKDVPPVKLTDYVTERLAPYAAALSAKSTSSTTTSTSTTYPSQRPSGKPPTPVDTVQAGLRSKYPTPSERRSNASTAGSGAAQGG